MTTRNFKFSALAAAGLLGFAGAAQAVDGVILIDQSRALAGSVTPGDLPGFPITITQPGSYRLASDLNVGAASATTGAILVQLAAGGDVTIDLNGFSIRGVDVCSLVPPSEPNATLTCTAAPASSVYGVSAGNSGTFKILNGTVRGFGGIGVYCFASTCRVDGVTASNNGSHGMLFNQFYGQTLVTHSAAFANGSRGFSFAVSGIIKDSLASYNKSDGIRLDDGLATGNAVRFNGGYGLIGRAGYAGNAFTGNGSGAVDPNGVKLGANTCNSSLCP